MALQPSDTAAWISIFRQHMDEMFNYLVHIRELGRGRHEFSPQLDVYETADAHVVEVDLPGFSANDFAVSITGSSIRIEGVKHQEKSDMAMSYICLERNFGRFSRVIDLPPQFDSNGAKAKYERGVLIIISPRITP